MEENIRARTLKRNAYRSEGPALSPLASASTPACPFRQEAGWSRVAWGCPWGGAGRCGPPPSPSPPAKTHKRQQKEKEKEKEGLFLRLLLLHRVHVGVDAACPFRQEPAWNGVWDYPREAGSGPGARLALQSGPGGHGNRYRHCPGPAAPLSNAGPGPYPLP